MRKILFVLAIILLLIITVFTVVKGFDIGNISVWGVQDIIEQNDLIDTRNNELSNLVSIKYQNELATLEISAQTLEQTRKEYEDLAALTTDDTNYIQQEKYEIEFLWTRLGNYAKDENVKIKIDVKNSSITGLYDLNFTVEGNYPDVTTFIYDIENDSRLGFRIEDFSMSSITGGVSGTFSCKEISINIEQLDAQTTEDTTNTDNTTNTTNTTTENTVNNMTGNIVSENNTINNVTTNTVNNTTTN